MSLASGIFHRVHGVFLSVLQRDQRETRKAASLACDDFRGVEQLEPRLLLSTTILSEGFENGFPVDNGWAVGDTNPLSTTSYWGAVDAAWGGEGVHSGNYKGYCAGVGGSGGSLSPHYVAYMEAYMSHTIDLRGYSNANLSFWYRIPDIEEYYDYAYVYIDNSLVWWKNERVTSWTNQVINLNDFLGGIHTLSFEFSSDVNINLEGWYLDDITVTTDATSADPNDQFFEATETSWGNTVSGTIEPTGSLPDPGSDASDVDMYKFSAVAGQQLTFDIDRTSGNLDSVIRLFDSYGYELDWNDDGAAPGESGSGDSYLAYTFSYPGTYYLGVSSYEDGWSEYQYDPITGIGDSSSSTSGGYNLTLENILMPDPNDQITESAYISVGDTVSGDISITGQSPDPGLDKGDVDMYQFSATKGETICFDIDLPAGSALDSNIRLFDAAGSPLTGGYNHDGAEPGGNSTDSYLVYTFTKTGTLTYYIGVSGYANTTYNAVTGVDNTAGSRGAYTLSLLHPDLVPVIDTFTVDQNPASVGQTVHLEVTAHDPDAGDSFTVSFYRDANGNGVAEASELIGEDLVDKDGWSLDWSTAGQVPPSVTLLATATDTRAGVSAPMSLTLALETETVPPVIVDWASAATQGASGEVLLAVPDDGTYVESRDLGRLVVQFSEAVAPASFTPGSVVLSGTDALGNPVDLTGITINTSTRNDGTEGVIDFSSALPNAATYSIRVQGVTDLAGNPLAGDDDRIVTALVGDANGDATVDAADYIAYKMAFGSAVSPTNAAIDFDCSGAVDLGDLRILASDSGLSMNSTIAAVMAQQALALPAEAPVAVEPDLAEMAAAASADSDASSALASGAMTSQALALSSPLSLSSALVVGRSGVALPVAATDRLRQRTVDVLLLHNRWASDGSDSDALAGASWSAGPLVDALGRARRGELNVPNLDVL